VRAVLLAAVVVSALGAAGVQAQQQDADPDAACRLVVQRSRMTDDGRRSMQELMRSAKASDLMDRLMHLAKSVGNGDVTAGVERVLVMMERKDKSGG
jgi:hypothetical protein